MDKCIGGCGFFGYIQCNASTFGLCSRCYQEQVGGSSASTGSSSQKAEAENKPSVIKCTTKINNITINVCLGDLTLEKVDAICNAANSSLDHASGLAGAIKKRGGRIIQDESDEFIAKNGRLEDGQVAVTSAGLLPCKMIIHCVGPIWHGGDQGEELFLEVAVRACLDQAAAKQCRSLAIPAISTGIFRFPKATCASVMFRVIEQYAREVSNSSLQAINLTNFDLETVQLFEAEFHKRFKS